MVIYRGRYKTWPSHSGPPYWSSFWTPCGPLLDPLVDPFFVPHLNSFYFCEFMDLDSFSVNKYAKKMNSANMEPSWPHAWLYKEPIHNIKPCVKSVAVLTSLNALTKEILPNRRKLVFFPWKKTFFLMQWQNCSQPSDQSNSGRAAKLFGGQLKYFESRESASAKQLEA